LDAARTVALRLRAHGHDAFVAGGAVRDHLLGRPPHDADVATSAHPDHVASLFPGSRFVGAAFGVVLVAIDGATIEVATFRKEGPYLDGRHPSRVEFATVEEDVRRRDFTINGLLLDPANGDVLDLVGGRTDLTNRVVRAIGDPRARFEEDHLRLLRAVRFAAQLAFTIEPATRAALSELADLVRNVAPERVRDELVRMLTGANARRGLELLHATGLLARVLPQVDAMRGVEQPPEYHPEGDVFVHTTRLFDHLERPTPSLAFGALLHDVGKPPTFERAPDRIRFPRHAKVGADLADAICRDLRFSNETREQIVGLVANHMRFMDVQRMKPSTLKRFLRLPGFDEHLALHRADCLASLGSLESWSFAGDRRDALGEETLRPEPLIDGNDLLEVGYPQGPSVGRTLRLVEELQLAG
jgi:poly(A) polymerase